MRYSKPRQKGIYQWDYTTRLFSGFWFSIEALLRYLIIKAGKTPTERPSPLISRFISEVVHQLGAKKKLRDLLNSLYARRRVVDHRKKVADKAYAMEAYNRFKEIIKIIEETTSIRL